jgi:hypothetical protein
LYSKREKKANRIIKNISKTTENAIIGSIKKIAPVQRVINQRVRKALKGKNRK